MNMEDTSSTKDKLSRFVAIQANNIAHLERIAYSKREHVEDALAYYEESTTPIRLARLQEAQQDELAHIKLIKEAAKEVALRDQMLLECQHLAHLTILDDYLLGLHARTVELLRAHYLGATIKLEAPDGSPALEDTEDTDRLVFYTPS
jgi:hypothetical protein